MKNAATRAGVLAAWANASCVCGQMAVCGRLYLSGCLVLWATLGDRVSLLMAATGAGAYERIHLNKKAPQVPPQNNKVR